MDFARFPSLSGLSCVLRLGDAPPAGVPFGLRLLKQIEGCTIMFTNAASFWSTNPNSSWLGMGSYYFIFLKIRLAPSFFGTFAQQLLADLVDWSTSDARSTTYGLSTLWVPGFHKRLNLLSEISIRPININLLLISDVYIIIFTTGSML